MYSIGECGAQIEMYGDPDGETIVSCARGRSMCCEGCYVCAEEICENCDLADSNQY